MIHCPILFYNCVVTEQATKAAEEEMEDTMMYDGDQQRYLQLLANGGEEETAVDASDIDSSDVASSDDISSDGNDSEMDTDKLRTSVARSQGRGKRRRSEMGLSSLTGAAEPHPLLAEIASKSERRQAATQRWFSDPLFADVDETHATPEDTVAEDDVDNLDGERDEEGKTLAKRRRNGVDISRGRKKSGEDVQKEGGEAAALLASMPKTEKEKRKEKRKKVRAILAHLSGPCVRIRAHCAPLLNLCCMQKIVLLERRPWHYQPRLVPPAWSTCFRGEEARA